MMTSDVALALRPRTRKIQETRLRWFAHVSHSDIESLAHIVWMLSRRVGDPPWEIQEAIDGYCQAGRGEDRIRARRRPQSTKMEKALREC